MDLRWFLMAVMFLSIWTQASGNAITCENDSDWKLYENHCYKFVPESADEGHTWWSSNQLCREEGAHLASILTKEENDWITDQIKDFAEMTLWTGGYSHEDTGFQWSDGNVFDFVNWKEGEPNGYLDQEDCIGIYGAWEQGAWNDQNCAKTIGRICKRPNGVTHPPPVPTLPMAGFCPKEWVHVGITGRCFRFFNEDKDFQSAHAACKAIHPGVNLASVHSAKEMAYITAGLGTLKKNAWLGLKLQDEFVWVDQSGMSYAAWGPGEPNGGSFGEECVEAQFPSGLWNDIYCDHQMGYVCSMNQDPNIAEDPLIPHCSEPFEQYISFRGTCYRPERTAKSWKEAEKTCSQEGGHLASAHDVSEGAFLWVLSQYEDFQDPWIGFNNIENHNLFQWTDSWPAFYTNWGLDEPDVNHTDYNCVRVNSEDGLWLSGKCDEIRPFLCKHINVTAPTPDPPTNGHCPHERWLDLNGGYCYLINTERKTWNDAHADCMFQDAHVASIHTEEEMKLLQFAMKDLNSEVWIGLIKKTSGLGWSDYTGYDYSNWAESEPNSEDEQCTEVYSSTGLWNDARCEEMQPYICKTPKIPDIENPDGNGNLSGGAIFGIIIAVLIGIAAIGIVVFYVFQSKNGNPPKLPFSDLNWSSSSSDVNKSKVHLKTIS